MEQYPGGSLIHLEPPSHGRLRLPRQKDGAGAGFQKVGLRILQKRFLACGKQIVWRFTKGINRQMPLSPGRHGRQMEINRIGTGIEHEA